MSWVAAFVVVTVLFVLVSGANDGATVLGLGLHYPRTPGMLALLVLLVMLVVVPLLIGFGVAGTFTERLADFGGRQGAAAFLGGVAVSLVVVGLLAWRGLPTSLTLGLIGGIAGAGAGAGLPVSWGRLGIVLAFGVAAPVVGGAVAFGLGVLSRRIPETTGMHRLTFGLHLLAFTAQCAAYAANDGQKMLAVASVATDVALRGGRGDVGPVDPPVPVLVGVSVVFGIGVFATLRRVGSQLGRGLVIARPMHVLSTEVTATATAFGGTAAGTPLSMSQAVSAGVVGVAATEGALRVRWPVAANIAIAWLATLPSALGLGFLAGLLVRLV